MLHSTDRPIIVRYGGGVNSTAALIGLVHRHVTPALILFADTGGELPETYAYVRRFSAWLVSRGRPAVRWVRYRGPDATLEAECLRKRVLPSLAYGGRSCSLKWKRDAQRQYVRMTPYNQTELIQVIGFHAEEAHRAEGGAEAAWYPLLEWDWGPQECEAEIRRVGLPVPPKSACFFCPGAKKHEVIRLSQCHPELFARAVAIEDAAENLRTVKGLGRHWRWSSLVKADEAQMRLMPEAADMPCLCGTS